MRKYILLSLILGINQFANAQWRPINTSTTDNGNVYHLVGNVGIGTSTPIEKLDVSGRLALYGTGLDGSTFQRFVVYADATNGLLFEAPKKSDGSRANIQFNWRGDATMPPLFVHGVTGNVGIGTNDPKGYKLAVAGKMVTEEIVIKLQTNWPDYVFETDYKMPSLIELEIYIKANKHLPDVPSATQLSKEGLVVGEMNAVLLKKIEELTLYLIDLEKKNAKQDELISKLLNQ
jgi:hypothetical protein